MQTRSIKSSIILGCTALYAMLPQTSQGDLTVHSGWDLLWTDPGVTFFMGQNWQGVPLNTYDFGGTVGVQNVGASDTIVQRLDQANSPQETIPIEMAALQLRTVTPVDLGAGLDFYYITLQSVRGGPDSTGDMTFRFESFFDVWTEISLYYDVRFGDLTGPIISSDNQLLNSSVNPWTQEPPPEVYPLIEGVNYLLNGTDTSEDFWPIGPIVETFPLGQHTVTSSPEPNTFILLLLGAGLQAVYRARRRSFRS